MSKQKVLNFFAGPGVGKSTMAAGTFCLLKMLGMNVELVQEYAKELAWAGVEDIQERELELLMEQHKRMQRLVGKVDLIITDSPLLLPLAYAKTDMLPHLHPLCMQLYSGEFDNYDYVLFRDKPYNPKGRYQTEEEAKEKDGVITNLVKGAGNPNGWAHCHAARDECGLARFVEQLVEDCGLHDCIRY